MMLYDEACLKYSVYPAVSRYIPLLPLELRTEQTYYGPTTQAELPVPNVRRQIL